MASHARPASVFRFGEFELNVPRGELRKAGIALRLHPQPFRVLLLLVERKGETVSRKEIRQCLWGENQFVDFDGGINFCIRQIRAALGDEAESPKYLETVPRQGYRFIYTFPHLETSEQHVILISSAPVLVPAASGPAKHAEHAPRVSPPIAPPQEVQAAGVASRRWLVLAAGFALAGLLAGAIFYFYRAPELTEKDAVVLADFENTTGDPVFDETLKQGLAVELAQSPFLNILPDQNVQKTLQLMERAAGDRLTSSVAREVCLRSGSSVYVGGSIGKLGEQYVVGLRAVNCATDEVLAQRQVTAEKKEEVLKALDRAAIELREKVGESSTSLRRFDTPIEQATTSSLDALQAYSLGRRAMIRESDLWAALPLFQEAIRLDPNFAMAFVSLALDYTKLGEAGLARQNYQKAYELRERASERERFYIESHYHFVNTGDLNRAQQIYELWSATYPADPAPLDNLGAIYRVLGQREERLQVNLEALRLDPQNIGAINGLANSYLTLDRLENARAVIRNAEANHLDSYALRQTMYQVAFLQKDALAMAEQLAWAAGRRGVEARFLSDAARTEAYFGRMQEARKLWRSAAGVAEREEQEDSATAILAELSLVEEQIGNSAAARNQLAAIAGRPVSYAMQVNVAPVIALAGDATSAESLAGEMASLPGGQSAINKAEISRIRAAVAIRHGHPEAAIEELGNALPYELGSDDGLYSAYLRGQAYLMLRRGDEATGEFQKILDHPGIVGNDPMGCLAHLQIARAYKMQGANGKARTAYQEFLERWRNADSDIPVFQQAKAEYAQIQ